MNFIHIGIGKTGTTSIQAALYRNREHLRALGFLYPQSGLMGEAHYGFFDLAQQEITEFAFADLAAERAAAACRDTILSCESLCYAAPAVIDRFAAALGEDTQIVFYVREQRALIRSTYLQWVREGWDHRGSIDEFWRAHQPSFDFSNLIAPWAERFGQRNIRAHVYDKRVIAGDVVAHFMGLVGYEGPPLTMERLNRSLAAACIPIVREVDALGLDSESRKLVVDSLARVSSGISAKAALIGDPLAQEIEQTYAESNARFAETYLPQNERFLSGVKTAEPLTISSRTISSRAIQISLAGFLADAARVAFF